MAAQQFTLDYDPTPGKQVKKDVVISTPLVEPATDQIWVGFGAVAAGVPASKFAVIAVGDNQTNQVAYTVPAGKTAYVKGFDYSSTKTRQVRINLEKKNEVPAAGTAFWLVKKVVFNYENSSTIDFLVAEEVAEKTTIRMSANADIATTSVSAAMHIFTIEDAT